MTARTPRKSPSKPALKVVAKAPEATLKAPPHLRETTQTWWLAVVGDFQLEEHHVRMLTLAAEAWDRAEQARELLLAEGITYQDRFGSPRKHPAVSIEESARIAFARMLRELDLDAESLPDPRMPRRGRR